MKLNLMEIERFAIHDGPGIRTTVFLQGCPLHCPWCANPESQRIGRQLLYRANKCVGCRQCVSVCPHGAITPDGDKVQLDRGKCRLCGACGDICLQDAIKYVGREQDSEEIVKTVLRDRDYYERSGGGVTISGGEPFVQYDGLLELLCRFKELGIHTAVETTGDTAAEKILAASQSIDLFLFDIKHTDPEKLHAVTGANAGLVMSNLCALAAQCPEKIILRVPVIPTFNFDAATLHDIFELAVRLRIAEVHLLPYHTLGISKYSQLGLDYSFPVDRMLNKAELEIYRDEAVSMGIVARIGG